ADGVASIVETPGAVRPLPHGARTPLAHVLGSPGSGSRAGDWKRRKTGAVLCPVPAPGAAARSQARHRRGNAAPEVVRGTRPILRGAVEYVEMAAAVSRVFLARGDGQAGPRPPPLPLRRWLGCRCCPRTNEARADRPRSVIQPLCALDRNRHARRRAAVRAEARTLRDDSGESRSARGGPRGGWGSCFRGGG